MGDEVITNSSLGRGSRSNYGAPGASERVPGVRPSETGAARVERPMSRISDPFGGGVQDGRREPDQRKLYIAQGFLDAYAKATGAPMNAEPQGVVERLISAIPAAQLPEAQRVLEEYRRNPSTSPFPSLIALAAQDGGTGGYDTRPGATGYTEEKGSGHPAAYPGRDGNYEGRTLSRDAYRSSMEEARFRQLERSREIQIAVREANGGAQIARAQNLEMTEFYRTRYIPGIVDAQSRATESRFLAQNTRNIGNGGARGPWDFLKGLGRATSGYLVRNFQRHGPLKVWDRIT